MTVNVAYSQMVFVASLSHSEMYQSFVVALDMADFEDMLIGLFHNSPMRSIRPCYSYLMTSSLKSRTAMMERLVDDMTLKVELKPTTKKN